MREGENMSDKNSCEFTCGGGCTAKLGAGFLKHVLESLTESRHDPNLLIGFQSSDDAAVYKITDDIAIIQTLDFFPPVVEDPYTFGKIAAANALSDIYAMGGNVKTALNIVCFPEKLDSSILADILRGGAEKVYEAGGIVCGGHSINDSECKYGLSVTGIVNPKNILPNNNCKIGDKLILTKPLGVGIITTANRVGEASTKAYEKAVKSMETLNKYASEIIKRYEVNACTDVTGFGFLGHLNEMTRENYTMLIEADSIPYITEAYDYAKEFLITAGGQKNRNHLKDKVKMENIEFALQEILFDPQTSGGFIISVNKDDAHNLLNELNNLHIKSNIVGEVTERTNYNIVVK